MKQKWDNYGTLLEHFPFLSVLVCKCVIFGYEQDQAML